MKSLNTISETLSALKKIAKKDPLRFVFSLLLIALLPLLVMSTLSEVMTRSRAAYPTSNVAGWPNQRLYFTSTFYNKVSCNETSCADGRDILIFRNNSNTTLTNITIKSFSDQSNKLTLAFTNSDGTGAMQKVDNIPPNGEVLVAVSPNSYPDGQEYSGSLSILFAGQSCNPGVACSDWQERSQNFAINMLAINAPDVFNPISFSDKNLSLSAKSFYILKNGKIYRGSKDSVQITSQLSLNEEQVSFSAQWREHGILVSLTGVIEKKSGDVWNLKKLTFMEGETDPNPLQMNDQISYSVPLTFSTAGNALFPYPKSQPAPMITSVIVVTDLQLRAFISNQESSVGIPLRPSDLNKDTYVDLLDYSILTNHFGQTGSAGFTFADINSDGSVNMTDYDLLISAIKSGILESVQ
ncbi:MAG: hypothetical protein COY81_04565 [Candidatus Pacebacteria bacterium CG_4_10_14_0_8_um_filter_43_12]|nr:MAG: hypothetical protein COY81_04565 [Candidatus Pacebacteria bacterium CG_4_10_14_0_8_um_filter_43_12]